MAKAEVARLATDFHWSRRLSISIPSKSVTPFPLTIPIAAWRASSLHRESGNRTHFHARTGQTIYFSSEHCEGSPLGFDLFDPSNNIIGGRAGCGESEPIKWHLSDPSESGGWHRSLHLFCKVSMTSIDAKSAIHNSVGVGITIARDPLHGSWQVQDWV